MLQVKRQKHNVASEKNAKENIAIESFNNI